jgi:hypothetical protein
LLTPCLRNTLAVVLPPRASTARITAVTAQMPAGALLPLASQGQRYAASASSVYLSGSQKPPAQRTATARAVLRTAIDSGSASHDGSTTILVGKAPKAQPSGLANFIAVKAASISVIP